MKKRILIITMIITLMMNTNIINAENDTSQVASKFSDIQQSDWFTKYITNLVDLKILDGYSDGTFKPNNSIQVDQFIKMTVTALGYTDIKIGQPYWATPYIDKAMNLGIVLQGEFDSFTQSIKRSEMAKIIVRAIGDKEEYPLHLEDYKVLIEDFDQIKTYDQETILKAYSKGIIAGYTDNTFKPHNSTTRAEASVMIVRLLDEEERKEPDFTAINDSTDDDEENNSSNNDTKEEQEPVTFTPDGRAIRTWDLPKNADEYEYILQDVPNEMYEKPRVIDNFVNLILPKDIKNDEWMQLKDNLEKWCDIVEKNVSLRINVDYKTIDYIWAEQLADTMFYGRDKHIETTKEYVDWVKENKIEITGEVKAEPSLTYMQGGGVWVRCDVRFDIKSFDKPKDVVFEDNSFNRFDLKDYYYKDEYKGYVDIQIGTNNIASLGQDLRIAHDVIVSLGTLKREHFKEEWLQWGY